MSEGLLRRRPLFSDKTFIYLLPFSKFPLTLPLSGPAEALLMPTGLDAKEATHEGVHQCAFGPCVQTQTHSCELHPKAFVSSLAENSMSRKIT